jgi:decaprenylphospho-beta-D-ribofuranose 2-oxidase
LKVEPLVAPAMWADIDRTDDLETAIGLVAEPEARHRYALAWIDLLGGVGMSPGNGRSVVVRSDYAHGAARAPASALTPLRLGPRVTVPAVTPTSLVRWPVVRAFNELRWRRAPRKALQQPMGFAEHFFPLDALGHWNRLYGPAGLVQYQFVVPLGQEATLLAAIDVMRRAGLPMYLAVLKRLGPGSGGLLSFPLPGVTLAVDIPASAAALPATLHRLDDMVAAVGGRVYLAKDALMRAASVGAMYPELARFREVCERVDPDGVLGSDMARRLDLRGRGWVGAA